jgi:hypothetical protein
MQEREINTASLGLEENKEQVAEVSARQYYEPDPAVLKRVIRKVSSSIRPSREAPE